MSNDIRRSTGLAWDRIGRWFFRGRLFRIAIQVRMLTLASLGVLLTIAGWWAVGQVFDNFDSLDVKALVRSYESCPWKTRTGGFTVLGFGVGGGLGNGPALGAPPNDSVVDPWHRLTAPVLQFYELTRTFGGCAFLLICIVWAAAVWGLFGGALTRSALVQLSREEPATLPHALGHAAKRWISYFSAPLLPIAAVLLVTLGLFLLGLIMRASVFVAALGYPLALLGGIVMALAMAGLSVGWPLMHATISAEGSDGFDAVSRSYSYVFQRPLHYLFYGFLAVLLGVLGLIVVDLFARGVWQLTTWSVSWGSGGGLMRKAIFNTGLSGSDAWGANVLDFWNGCVRLVVGGYAFAFFWTAVSAAYLLLRYDADGAEPDEIYRQDGDAAYGLPTLVKDAAGVPTVPANEVVPPTTPPAFDQPASPS